MRGGRARCTSEPPPRDPTDLIVASLSAGSYPHAPWGNVQTGAPLPILDGKYQLLRQLGEGGMGAVYEARHKATGRHVAVKVIVGEALAKNAEVVRRFEREAMATGKIQSQYIAHTLDAGVDPATGSPYLVMDLFQGEDLQHAIGRLGPLQPDVALRIAAQVCLGLQKAHEADVIHRDIKPANIFLARHEESEIVVKILDFGIAKVKLDGAEAPGPAMTRTGSMLGSPLYMSPEQARGRKTVDQRSDIWSVGVVLYEALTGTTPHAQAETIGEIIIQICATPPRPVQELAPWVPQAVADIVHKALALDPAARFASAREMYEAIRPLPPFGYTLDQSMFVPLTREVRSTPAPRISTRGDLRAPTPPVSLLPSEPSVVPAASGGLQASTAAGFSQTAAGESAPTHSPRTLISIGVAVVAGVALGGIAMMHGAAPASGVAPTSAGLVLPAVASSPPPMLPATASATAATVDAVPVDAAPPVLISRPARLHTSTSPVPATPTCRVVSYFDGDGNKRFRQECQ